MSDQYPQDRQDPQPTQTYGQQAPQPTYHAQPPAMSAEDERTWGALSHGGAVIAMICSAGFLGFVASVAVYMIQKDRGVPLVVLGILTIPVALLTLGLGLVVMLPALAAAFVFAGVLHVVGAIKAYNGEWWNPPFTPRFVK